MLVSRSTQQGQIEEDEREMIDKVFVFGDKDVADVMVAKPDVSAVSVDMPAEEALAVVLDSPFTRYPVFRESLDDIVGVLHVRDLFNRVFTTVGWRGLDLASLLRPAYVIPETKDLGFAPAGVPPHEQPLRRGGRQVGAMAGIRATPSRKDLLRGDRPARSRTSSTCPRSKSSRSPRRVPRRRDVLDRRVQRAVSGTELPGRGLPHGRRFRLRPARAGPRPGDDVSYDGMRFDVLEVEGNRIERIAVTFEQRPEPRRIENRDYVDEDGVE